MDKIGKALKKFTQKEREIIKGILAKIKRQRLGGLDLKKLKGRDDIFRVRKGEMRIIYRTDRAGNIFILSVEKRSDTTYNI